MQKKVKIIMGALSATLLISGGVALANTYSNPATQTQVSVEDVIVENPSVKAIDTVPNDTTGKLTFLRGEYVGETKDGMASGKGIITYNNGDTWKGDFLFNQESGTGIFTGSGTIGSVELTYPVPTAAPKSEDASHRVPPPEGAYYPKPDRPTGIYIHKITFHEGFRTPGMKAVDIHIMARSNNSENELIQGRDEIVSITGTTGKVYDMTGTKRTGINTNAAWENYQEQEITQYQDVSVNEKGITSIVVRRDGQLITVKPDENTKYDTTHR
ncbi:hypothetical protein [Desulfosporosinus youngiae]|uniref:MORN repeat protein n=1 Tax=Desulfosporosinus youngiae DSM 17734 TaxID=768710 RepID=H5XUS1_9FIRM|nr:hypothetical protein [Desulfosporosinus youngiae]EHQ89228.1 hypothetical protein DesyoDRAFT_2143 [Desulfosporosinus youngiae DSM 17734]